MLHEAIFPRLARRPRARPPARRAQVAVGCVCLPCRVAVCIRPRPPRARPRYASAREVQRRTRSCRARQCYHFEFINEIAKIPRRRTTAASETRDDPAARGRAAPARRSVLRHVVPARTRGLDRRDTAHCHGANTSLPRRPTRPRHTICGDRACAVGSVLSCGC